MTDERFTLNFHWLDNVTDIYDLHSWFTTGDSAPERRNDYTLTLTVPYEKQAEEILPPRMQGAVCYMPAVSVREEDLQAGLRVTLYTLPENYGKMPVFGHIAANAAETSVIPEVSLTAAGERRRDFALGFEGYVHVPADGVYEFPLRANDGACLYIDGRLVTKIMRDVTEGVDKTPTPLGALPLAKGYHAIRIEYANVGDQDPELSLEENPEFFCS